MKPCSRCGAANRDAARFCAQCGAKMDAAQETFGTESNGPKIRCGCSVCGQHLSATPDMAGTVVNCPACGTQIQLPPLP